MEYPTNLWLSGLCGDQMMCAAKGVVRPGWCVIFIRHYAIKSKEQIQSS